MLLLVLKKTLSSKLAMSLPLQIWLIKDVIDHLPPSPTFNIKKEMNLHNIQFLVGLSMMMISKTSRRYENRYPVARSSTRFHEDDQEYVGVRTLHTLAT